MLIEETGEFTDGRAPGKRNNRRQVSFHVDTRRVSEENGYRVEPSIETGMFSGAELATATANELQAHNLYKDRKYFQLAAAYVGTNSTLIAKTDDIVSSYEPVLELVADLVGNAKDGLDFAGNSYINEHPSTSEVTVIGTHKELTTLAALYMTEKGVGSNAQFTAFENKTSEQFTFAGITFKAVALANQTATGTHTINGAEVPVRF